jgi:hypothetical protein
LKGIGKHIRQHAIAAADADAVFDQFVVGPRTRRRWPA